MFPIEVPTFPDFPEAPTGSWWYKLSAWDVSLVMTMECSDPSEWRVPFGCYVETEHGNYGIWQLLRGDGRYMNVCIRVWCDTDMGLNIACLRSGYPWVWNAWPLQNVTSVRLSLPIFDSPDWMVYPGASWQMLYFEGSPRVIYSAEFNYRR